MGCITMQCTEYSIWFQNSKRKRFNWHWKRVYYSGAYAGALTGTVTKVASVKYISIRGNWKLCLKAITFAVACLYKENQKSSCFLGDWECQCGRWADCQYTPYKPFISKMVCTFESAVVQKAGTGMWEKWYGQINPSPHFQQVGKSVNLSTNTN